MKRLIWAVVFILLTSLTGAAQSGACDEGGSLARERFQSAVDGILRYYSIYLPPCYHALADEYPALMLLHGSNADDRQWARLGFIDALDDAIRDGGAPPMIVLMPSGGAIANENEFAGLTYDAILLDFLSQRRQSLRISDKQAIGGISRGGFWAYHLGLRFPNDFAAVGGHSPFFDPDHAPDAFNPLDLAETLSAESAPKLWLDRGTRDHASEGVERVRVILQRQRLPHEYSVYAGGDHSEASWRLFVNDYVAFYASAFSGARESVEVTEAGEPGYELWLPAVGFGTLLTSIASHELAAVLEGHLDSRLILSESTKLTLESRGHSIHQGTQLVANDQLFRTMWREKRSYTLMPFDELHLHMRPLWIDNVPVVDQLESYPLAFESGAPNFDLDRLTRITLSGTTALARHTLPAIDALGVDEAASGIQAYVRASDFFQITNEASIAEKCPEPEGLRRAGDRSMCMKRDHLRLFDLLDVDVVDLTGNHINDYGAQPLRDTIDEFEARGIYLVGGGRTEAEARAPLILEHNGSRIGWVACNDVGPSFAYVNENPQGRFGTRAGAATCDRTWLRETLGALAADVDLVLMTVQYREFEQFLPQSSHEYDYKTFAEWGADIVIGTAEHKPMTFEFYPTQRGETAFIHYGLGNLFFDQLPWGNRRFFLDTLYIYDGQLLTVEVFPGVIDDRARPRLLTGDDQFNFLHFMFIQKNGF